MPSLRPSPSRVADVDIADLNLCATCLAFILPGLSLNFRRYSIHENMWLCILKWEFEHF